MRRALTLAALCATTAARQDYSKHGHRLQYAVDDQGKEPDAVETLFVGALGLAHDLAALYQVT